MKNEVHTSNLHVKTHLWMYDKGGNSTKNFPSQEGGLRTIRKTEPEENNGILKNPFHTLHKEPKGITYVGFFFQIESNAKMIVSITGGHTQTV